MYFAGGLGQTGLQGAETSSAVGFHVGTGQIFAMSKSVGLRWDLSFNFFNAVAKSSGAQSQFNTALLTIGASFFFPEAKYR